MAMKVLPVSAIQQRNKAFMGQLQHTVQVGPFLSVSAVTGAARHATCRCLHGHGQPPAPAAAGACQCRLACQQQACLWPAAVQRWEACPGARRQIEDVLAARLADRVSLAQHGTAQCSHQLPTLPFFGGAGSRRASLPHVCMRRCSAAGAARRLALSELGPTPRPLAAFSIPLQQLLMRSMARNRPAALLEVWAGVTCPPAPPGTPSIDGRPPLHPMLLPIAVSEGGAAAWRCCCCGRAVE